MSSPEPRRSLVILQPLSRSMPRARMTRSCAAIVYLNDRGTNSKTTNASDSSSHAHWNRWPESQSLQDRINIKKIVNYSERKMAVGAADLCRSSGSQLARNAVTASATSWLERTSQRPSVPMTRTSSAPCSYCRLYTLTCMQSMKDEGFLWPNSSQNWTSIRFPSLMELSLRYYSAVSLLCKPANIC